MEVTVAGWSMSGLFSRKKGPSSAPVGATSGSVMVKPPARETSRRSEPGSALPRFNTTAGDQASGRGGDRFSALRARLRNAFTPSQPIAERRLFAGREDVLKSMIRSIEDQRLHVVIYGERGIGKTSLLHILTQAATEARYIVVYSSCGANSNFDDTFRAAAADIPLLYHSGFSPTGSEAEKGSTLADLLPTEPLSPRKFGDLCAKLTGTRVLIILDEYDRAESAAFRRDMAELIKNLSDRLGRVQIVLAGVAADLTDLVEHIPSIRRNIFALRVPKMSETEVMQIVTNGEREADLKFEADASAFVVAVARGLPYMASLICHHAGHAALDQGRSAVLAADVQVAIGRAVEEFQGRVPTPAQAQVRRLFEMGRHDVLGMTARAALSADGIFTVADFEAANEVTSRKAQDAIDVLLAEHMLRTVPSDDDVAHYGFVEEGLPTLIWMMWTQKSFNRKVSPPAQAPAQRAAVSS